MNLGEGNDSISLYSGDDITVIGSFTVNNLPVNCYFGKLAPMTVEYKTSDKSYVIHNEACVETLSNDFTKITFDTSAAEDYAYFEVNDTEFLIANGANNLNVIEANGNAFKIQGKEIDAEKIGRVTIDFDGVKVNYALNKPVIYSLDGKKVTIDDAATVTTGDETKTITCAAGSYVINGRNFETSADLTFTADASSNSFDRRGNRDLL